MTDQSLNDRAFRAALPKYREALARYPQDTKTEEGKLYCFVECYETEKIQTTPVSIHSEKDVNKPSEICDNCGSLHNPKMPGLTPCPKDRATEPVLREMSPLAQAPRENVGCVTTVTNLAEAPSAEQPVDITDLAHEIARMICSKQGDGINIYERDSYGKYLWEAYIPEARKAIKMVVAWQQTRESQQPDDCPKELDDAFSEIWKGLEAIQHKLHDKYHFDLSAIKKVVADTHALCRPFWDKMLAGEPERESGSHYRMALEHIREIWAGSECGEPKYAQEAYAINLCKEMYQEAVDALRNDIEGEVTK